MRSNVRRHQHNLSLKTRLKTLEKRFLGAVKSGQRDEASAALRTLSSALDKSAKSGVIHQNQAARKKSRLSTRLAASATS